MLELLILLPLIMVSILTMTFEVSVDELSNASRGHYFRYDEYDGEKYRSLQNKVHEFYARMLDDSENEIEEANRTNSSRRKKSRKGLSGQTCDIEAIQVLQRRCLCKKPRKRCVRIELPSKSVVTSLPECVMIERCEGVCPPFKQCNPLEVKKITIPVIYLNLVVTESGSDLKADCSTVALEKHLKCGCSCSVTEKDCNPIQEFNPSLCRCECSQTERAKDCQRSGKYWDAANCDCVCPPNVSHICSTGAFFDQQLCRCVPIDKSSQGRRWKRPV